MVVSYELLTVYLKAGNFVNEDCFDLLLHFTVNCCTVNQYLLYLSLEVVIDVGRSSTPMCNTTPQGSCHITCYLGNVTLKEKSMQHFPK